MEAETSGAARRAVRGLCAAVSLVLAFAARGQTFSNPTPIVIPAVGTSGVASPYPSTISVSGVGTSLAGLAVTLTGLAHSFPDDIDMLLVAPDGRAFRLLTDCGGNPVAVGLTLTLSDAATNPLPDFGPLVSGVFRPSSYGGGPIPDTFPPPAPPGAQVAPPDEGEDSFASVFGGTDPNGTWSLYVLDDASGDSGSISGGWSLTITATPVELMRFEAE